VGLASALQPCTVAQCVELRAECAAKWAGGQFAFKHKPLLELCQHMRVAQGWTSSKGQRHNAAGSAPPAVLAAGGDHGIDHHQSRLRLPYIFDILAIP
jgi:hypothetical protein